MKIVIVQTNTMMGLGMDFVMAHTETWFDMEAGITTTSEAAEIMTEAMIPGLTVSEEHLVVG